MNLEQYIKTIKEAIRKAYNAYEEARMDHDIADEALKNRAGSGKVSDERVIVEREDIAAKFRAAVDKVQTDVHAVIDQQKAAYLEEVAAYYAPDGAKIDMNDMNLFKSGLVLSVDDIWNRILKYADNMTMLKIIQQHITDKHISLDSDTGAKISQAIHRLSLNGAGEKKALKNFISLACEGLNHLGLEGDIYILIRAKLDEYELQAQADILKAQPVRTTEMEQKIASLELQAIEKRDARVGK